MATTTTYSITDAHTDWFDIGTPFHLRSVTLSKCINMDTLWSFYSYISLKSCSDEWWSDAQSWYYENGYLINAITRKVLADNSQADPWKGVLAVARQDSDYQKWIRV